MNSPHSVMVTSATPEVIHVRFTNGTVTQFRTFGEIAIHFEANVMVAARIAYRSQDTWYEVDGWMVIKTK